MFRLHALRYRYGQTAELRFPDWSLQQGEQAVLRGPSGSGKSTLLSLLAGLLQPQQGDIWLAEQALAALPPAQRDAWRGRHIGFIPQRAHLLASLNVLENLQLAQYLARLPQDAAQCQRVLASLGLSELAGRRPQQLSQGQAQRVAIARALLNHPKLLLADEPSASLDDANTTAVLDLLQGAAQQAGATLLVASHDARVHARFDRQFLLEARA